MTTSSEEEEEEESDDSEEDKMHVDGVTAGSTKVTATDAKPKMETRYNPPTPAADAGPGSPSPHK